LSLNSRLGRSTLTKPSDNDYVIGRASREDITSLLDLQTANLAAVGGGLSVQFSSEWLERSMDEMPIIVATRAGALVGYLVSSSRNATRHIALSEAKYRAYPTLPDSYNSGPLCVAACERGRGLAARLFQAMRAQLPGREAVCFIRRDNLASRALHRKLGFREVAEFTHVGIDYLVAAHRESATAPSTRGAGLD
jgi:L-amino acid N-acyltransferase YncA